MPKESRVFVLVASNEFELVKKMNECDKDFFASQPMQKKDGSWVCFIYYKQEKGGYNNHEKRTY